MCGRYLITSNPEAVRALFRYLEQPNFPARYNIAPTQPMPIVRIAEGERHFALVRWGLVPSWVKDPRAFSLLNNARGETVNEKPAFRNAMKRRRCLIPADGFYEWKQEGGRKQPFLIRPRDGAPLAFAGLWETWMGPNGEEMETAAIITTQANRDIAHVHDRMPVIIPPDTFDFWLDCNKVDAVAAAAILVPARMGLLEAYEVSTAVNRVANDGPALLERVVAQAATEGSSAKQSPPAKRTRAPKKDDRQSSLF